MKHYRWVSSGNHHQITNDEDSAKSINEAAAEGYRVVYVNPFRGCALMEKDFPDDKPVGPSFGPR